MRPSAALILVCGAIVSVAAWPLGREAFSKDMIVKDVPYIVQRAHLD